LNGGLGLFVLAASGLLEQKRPDKLFFHFFAGHKRAMFLARSICSDLNGSRRADRRTGTNSRLECDEPARQTEWKIDKRS
jgi:hypothetical protein